MTPPTTDKFQIEAREKAKQYVSTAPYIQKDGAGPGFLAGATYGYAQGWAAAVEALRSKAADVEDIAKHGPVENRGWADWLAEQGPK